MNMFYGCSFFRTLYAKINCRKMGQYSRRSEAKNYLEARAVCVLSRHLIQAKRDTSKNKLTLKPLTIFKKASLTS